MTSPKPVMPEPGDGERAEKARKRRFWAIVIGLMVAGGIIGGVQSVLTRGDPSAGLPAFWGIALAVIWFVSVLAGSWFFFKSVDEVEVRDNLFAGTIAAYWYGTIYPVWYFLWKGGVVPEPMHEAIFITTMLAMAAGYLGKKIRP